MEPAATAVADQMLELGETLRWVGRPSLRADIAMTIPVMAMLSSAAIMGAIYQPGGAYVGWCMATFSVACIVEGLIRLIMVRSTVYAVTDRRVVTIRRARRAIDNGSLDDLGSVIVEQAPDGSGHVSFKFDTRHGYIVSHAIRGVADPGGAAHAAQHIGFNRSATAAPAPAPR